jgi:hypothetical protein
LGAFFAVLPPGKTAKNRAVRSNSSARRTAGFRYFRSIPCAGQKRKAFLALWKTMFLGIPAGLRVLTPAPESFIQNFLVMASGLHYSK